MKKIVLSLLVLLSASFAKEHKIERVELQWSAFKTPKKVAVKGKFNTIKLVSKAAGTRQDSLVGTAVTITTSSVNSSHKGRDAKLYNSYFKLFLAPTIKAEIVSIEENHIVNIQIDMNGVKKVIPFKATKPDKVTMKLKGSIDMLDFSLAKALKSINQACLEKHKGKTWSDVALDVTLHF